MNSNLGWILRLWDGIGNYGIELMTHAGIGHIDFCKICLGFLALVVVLELTIEWPL
jgi:hypothetical protein